MLNRIRRRLTYANVVASAALFIALGGVGYAATTAAKNSVKSSSIKNGQVKNVDLGSNAVTSNKIKDGQVKGADVLESSLSKVPTAAKADIATNATNATNANTVGGLAPTAFVQKADALTRHFSCAGTAWENVFSSDTYGAIGSDKFGTAGTPLFRCSVAIPDGATITAVNFSVRDTSNTATVDCELWRTNMATTIGNELLLASAATGTVPTPGLVRISDTTVTQPTIDNDNFAYFVQCRVGPNSATAVFGTNLTYTTTGGGAAPAASPLAAPSGASGGSSAR